MNTLSHNMLHPKIINRLMYRTFVRQMPKLLRLPHREISPGLVKRAQYQLLFNPAIHLKCCLFSPINTDSSITTGIVKLCGGARSGRSQLSGNLLCRVTKPSAYIQPREDKHAKTESAIRPINLDYRPLRKRNAQSVRRGCRLLAMQ